MRLRPGRWIQLPGTAIEVYLRGKYRDNGPVDVVEWRHDEQTDTGYWDLTGIYHRLYVRALDLSGQPVRGADAVRPRIKSRPEVTSRTDRPVTAAYPWSPHM